MRLAHTAPIYLEGRWDAAEDAKFFLQWIDELIAKTARQQNAEKLHALYRKAREFYAGKAGPAAADGAAFLKQGLALFNQGRMGEAADVLRRALAADPLNQAIIKLLQQDGRLPFSTLARHVETSEATVRNRVNRMIAARMLRVGRDAVARVAERSGYESETAFIRAFKREFGMPPAAWRKAGTG